MSIQNKGKGQPNIITSFEQISIEQVTGPFSKLRKISVSANGGLFEDDQFRLPEIKPPKGVVLTRLSKIYPIGLSISQPKSNKSISSKQKIVHHHPTYLAELKILPQWHYLSLIEPRVINGNGFYHVAVVQDGRITKILIDDYVYCDQLTNQISSHPLIQQQPVWVHIILKAWAKINKGYDKLYNCQPFSFIQAFTYPDWSIFNPQLETLHTVISKIGQSSQKEYLYIAKTKSDVNVGLYGLIPSCASYVISGYYQEYANIFLKIKSFVGDQWNGCYHQKDIQLPSDPIHLGQGEFIMPLKIFINIFHLIYFTPKKYERKQRLFYNQYIVNLDARQSKANFIEFEVFGQNLVDRLVSINFYFPSVKPSDFGNLKQMQKRIIMPPSSKICIGRAIQKQNYEGSLSHAQSLKESILRNQQAYFINQTSSKYEHVISDFFKGYANEVTYHLKLKPGKYIIRLKIQKLLPQYRAIINFTSNQDLTVSQRKMTKKQQIQYLSQVLSNRARKQQKNVIYPFPHRKQSWIMANYDFQAIGYGTIIFQTGKNDNYLMAVSINAKKLRQGGYRIKDKIELIGVHKQMRLKEGESIIIILKKDIDNKQNKDKQPKWPPQGIEISYQPIQNK